MATPTNAAPFSVDRHIVAFRIERAAAQAQFDAANRQHRNLRARLTFAENHDPAAEPTPEQVLAQADELATLRADLARVTAERAAAAEILAAHPDVTGMVSAERERVRAHFLDEWRPLCEQLDALSEQMGAVLLAMIATHDQAKAASRELTGETPTEEPFGLCLPLSGHRFYFTGGRGDAAVNPAGRLRLRAQWKKLGYLPNH